mmetsp:Transcript_148289/g.413013  ORF Transcript_148289/g.413013 Transcript_148289/m.413013 type:complete len:201 (-) Transcript_148289:1158-1760(-)
MMLRNHSSALRNRLRGDSRSNTAERRHRKREGSGSQLPAALARFGVTGGVALPVATLPFWDSTTPSSSASRSASAAASASVRRSRPLVPHSRPAPARLEKAMTRRTLAPQPLSSMCWMPMMLTTPMRLLNASRMELTVASRAGKQTSLPSSQEQPQAGTERPMKPMATTKTLPCIWKCRQANAIRKEIAMAALETTSVGR